MTRPRLFQVARGVLSEIQPERISSVKWTDALTIQPTASIRLNPTVGVTPASAPESVMIVPSQRETLNVPIYGPYETTSYGWDGEGYTLEATLGLDFAARFATAGDDALLSSIVSQIGGFSRSAYEPFLTWSSIPDADDVNVAKLGLDALSALIVSGLYNVASIPDLESLLTSFGLSAYIQVDWPRAGLAVTEKFEIWPVHPIARTVVSVDATAAGTTYYIRPRVGAVSSWVNNLPAGFLSPNLRLPNNGEIIEVGNIQHHPSINAPDLLNAPHGGTKPSYRTRRINVGYRLLGVEETIELYHTGTREPAIYRNPQVVNTAGSTKMGEEIARWELQNNAANITLKRFVDDTWETISSEFFAPHQIVKMPQAIFPEGWDLDNHRDFVVRSVTHQFTGQEGYSQEISGTLWQGPFERLTAIAD